MIIGTYLTLSDIDLCICKWLLTGYQFVLFIDCQIWPLLTYDAVNLLSVAQCVNDYLYFVDRWQSKRVYAVYQYCFVQCK